MRFEQRRCDFTFAGRVSGGQLSKPRAYVSTLAELGNMTLATVGVNLALHQGAIATDYIGCITLGGGRHFAVSLLKT